MGMFDYLKCELQLPGYSYITDEEFQTKAFERLMETYVITANRQIYRELWDYEWTQSDSMFGGYLEKVDGTYRREYLTDLHGDIIFYRKGYDYFARFSYGVLREMWVKEWNRW